MLFRSHTWRGLGLEMIQLAEGSPGRSTDSESSALIIGRAVASTVVTMAEMGSIGNDILAAHGITEIDPDAWYPSQLRREIHEAVWQRFGDIALLSFGVSQLDYYPQALEEVRQSLDEYLALIDVARTDAEKSAALALFVQQMTRSYHRATSASMRRLKRDMKASARWIDASASRRRLSSCTTPVSTSAGDSLTGRRAVRSTSHGATDERTMTSRSGRRSNSALMISMERDAWPNPCPEI